MSRVAVVTGGGGGIGAAIAEELGRTGAFVVTVDPLVTVDGAEQLPPPEETTAGRIVAAGGSARASSVSVTDAEAVRSLFEELVAEHGRLDAVVNVAGITRPTSFAAGSDDDWRDVLAVHLDGYLNVLRAALPLMAAAGHGRILGVTSGSGWRAADAGAYGVAKRAVAALTWQLGRQAPPGVVVNALSPIAATRMVAAALARTSASAGGANPASGGLSLASMPGPEELGPIGAHLVGDGFSWCSGRVIFAAGSEAAVIEEPRLLEVVRTDGVAFLAPVLEAVTERAWAPAEAQQVSSGATNPRFGEMFDGTGGEVPATAVRSCAIVTDRPALGAAVVAAIEARGATCTTIDAGTPDALAAAGWPDAVVVALAGPRPAAGEGWARVLTEHEGIADLLYADARWARAVADAERPVRLVMLVDATTAGGRSRAQAVSQLARAGRRATDDRAVPFAVSVESDAAEDVPAVAALAAHLACSPGAPALSGAELAAGRGWVGLRSHPHPGGSLTYGGPALPSWFDEVLGDIAGVVR